MKPTEIKDLVAGLLTIILMAIVLGQFGRLEKFSRAEAAKALRPKPTPAFFPQGYGGR